MENYIDYIEIINKCHRINRYSDNTTELCRRERKRKMSKERKIKIGLGREKEREREREREREKGRETHR